MSSALVRYCVIFTRSETSNAARESASPMLAQASVACSSKSPGIVPSARIPGVPAVASQRAPGKTSTASL